MLRQEQAQVDRLQNGHAQRLSDDFLQKVQKGRVQPAHREEVILRTLDFAQENGYAFNSVMLGIVFMDAHLRRAELANPSLMRVVSTLSLALGIKAYERQDLSLIKIGEGFKGEFPVEYLVQLER